MTATRARKASTFWVVVVAAVLVLEAAGALAFGLRSGARSARPDDPGACAGEGDEAQALATEVRSLRARLEDAERRLAARAPAGLRGEAAARGTGEASPSPAPTDEPAAAPRSADETVARVAAVQAQETPDPRWAAQAEGRLRELALALSPAASVDRIRCTGTLCTVELTHGAGAIDAKPIDTFVAGAEDMMPQALVQPDAQGGRTTVVFARAGASLPHAQGGGS